LLPQATELEAVNADYRARLTPELIREIVGLVPDEWLQEAFSADTTAQEQWANYISFLEARLAASDTFVQEAQHARQALI
jgi:hypothetical protein